MSIYIEKLKKTSLPLVDVKGFVLFPKIPTSFEVTDKRTIDLIKNLDKEDMTVFVATRKELVDSSEPTMDNIFTIGCIAEVKQITKMAESGAYRVIVEGLDRGEISSLINNNGEIECEIIRRHTFYDINTPESVALVRNLLDIFDEYRDYFPKASGEISNIVESIEDPGILCDFLAANIIYKFGDKERILEVYDVNKRVEMLSILLHDESEILKAEKDIAKRVQMNLSHNQREIYLREQLRVIQSELGDGNEYEDELQAKLEEAKLPEEIKERLQKEYAKMERMSFGSAEATVIRNYIETCLEIPFGNFTVDNIDLKKAEAILDRDHFGLEKVKERILEFLAVKKISPDLKGQILCLVGPPGVGKTSIAKSIAEALGRNYVRASLGGVRDEADIRGHRKTYIGAMPGRIIDALTQSGSMNPLFLLDEVDKLTRDAHGDPSSALLEVLDSEQNNSFRDHFIEFPVDLSECIFIATANNLDTIPKPLLDRMEIIQIPSYTENEKVHIASRHLVKKQLARHGLKKDKVRFTDGAIRLIIQYYTKESGVRNLEREIARACRKIAKNVVETGEESFTLDKNGVIPLMGRRKIKPEKAEKKPDVGVVNGLAWTEVGGEMLKIEAVTMEGSGKIELTGMLGDVMKESAQIAVSLIRTLADKYGIENKEFYKNRDIHIHAPEGAVPKDGPSAGVTMTTALISELSGIPVRQDIAMTGEITLKGKVLPIGGLREKTMAAYAYGVKTVIVPKENLDDKEDIDPEVRAHLEIIGAETIDDVLKIALVR